MTTKIYGTTIFIGKTPISTIYGDFKAYTFQSLISAKQYTVALTFGDINADELYTRIHSSCVTSETICGMDCDCVEQLYGAMKRIVDEKNGILFYLIQEGRGAGYVAKARDRMVVQHSGDTISTFEAYHSMGLKNDHREYSAIRDICKILSIDPKFIVLTNNPDKIKALKDLELTVLRSETLEYTPGPFNVAYLKSKKAYGHDLHKVINDTLTKEAFIDEEPLTVTPFQPYNLPKLPRFVHCASYYIPIKPTNDMVFLTDEEYSKFQELEATPVNGGYIVKVLKNMTIMKPYWFKVNVYWDVITSNDYVILEYSRCESLQPLVRIHSESIFNRFPLKNPEYRNVYQQAVLEIVKHGKGYIALFYQDGRGHGLGAYILDKIKKDDTLNDNRDYNGICKLLQEYINSPITLLVNKDSPALDKAISETNMLVKEKLFLNQDVFGHNLLWKRMISLPAAANQITAFEANFIDFEGSFIVTGVGSSKAHAMYMVYWLRNYNVNAEFRELSNFESVINNKHSLILFSQGLSPNATLALSKKYTQIIIFTAVSQNNIKKKHIFDKANLIFQYPLEDEYTLLVRVVGPYCGFIAVNKFMNTYFKEPMNSISKLQHDFINPNPDLINYIAENRPQIKLITNDYMIPFLQNIQYKFMEGCFYPHMPDICDYLEFSHGHYQNLLENQSKGIPTLVIILNQCDNPELSSGIINMCKTHDIRYHSLCGLSKTDNISYCELYFNQLMYKLIKRWNIDQINWKGKDDNTSLYALCSD